MPLIPPHNTAGIVRPANPQNPPTFADITNAKEYVEHLVYSKSGTYSQTSESNVIFNADLIC
jgi:hypothetical protein